MKARADWVKYVRSVDIKATLWEEHRAPASTTASLARINFILFIKGREQLYPQWTWTILFKKAYPKSFDSQGRHGNVRPLPSIELIHELVLLWANRDADKTSRVGIEGDLLAYILSTVVCAERPGEWARITLKHVTVFSEFGVEHLCIGANNIARFNTKNVSNYRAHLLMQKATLAKANAWSLKRWGVPVFFTIFLAYVKRRKHQAKPDDLLFRKLWKATDVKEVFRKVAFIVEELPTNYLRHTGITYMSYGNVPSGEATALGGWSTFTKDEIYREQLVSVSPLTQVYAFYFWSHLFNHVSVCLYLQIFEQDVGLSDEVLFKEHANILASSIIVRSQTRKQIVTANN